MSSEILIRRRFVSGLLFRVVVARCRCPRALLRLEQVGDSGGEDKNFNFLQDGTAGTLSFPADFAQGFLLVFS